MAQAVVQSFYKTGVNKVINVLYEDNHLLVVEKPVNVPVQADSSEDSDLLGRYNLLLDSDSYFDYQQNLLFYNNRMNRKYHIINTSPSFYAKKAYKKLFK